MWALALLTAAAACLAASMLPRLLAWARARACLASIPGPPAAGVMGHADIMVDPKHHEQLAAWAQLYGGVFKLRMVNKAVVVVTDPHAVARLVEPGREARREIDKSVAAVYSRFNNAFHARGLPNLFTASTSDPYWKAVRRGVAPAFASKNLRTTFAATQRAAAELVTVLTSSAGCHVDVADAASRMALDVIGDAAFGARMGALAGLASGKRCDVFDMLLQGRIENSRRWRNPLRQYMLFLPSVRAANRGFVAYRARMSALLADAKARIGPSGGDSSIVGHLLATPDPHTGGPLPADRLAAEVGLLFTGGFETTGHTVAWAMLCIVTHPATLASVRAELDAAGLLASRARPCPRAPEYDDAARLPVLDAAVKEAMRLFPAVVEGTNRTPDRDVVVGGHTVPAGTMVWAPYWALFRSPAAWDEPDTFNPGRWASPGAEYAREGGAQIGAEGDKARPMAAGVAVTAGAGRAGGADADAPATRRRPLRFTPFSVGARDCVGQTMARHTVFAALATMLGRFDVVPAPGVGGYAGGAARASSAGFTLAPEGGLPMIFTPHCVTGE